MPKRASGLALPRSAAPSILSTFTRHTPLQACSGIRQFSKHIVCAWGACGKVPAHGQGVLTGSPQEGSEDLVRMLDQVEAPLRGRLSCTEPTMKPCLGLRLPSSP